MTAANPALRVALRSAAAALLIAAAAAPCALPAQEPAPLPAPAPAPVPAADSAAADTAARPTARAPRPPARLYEESAPVTVTLTADLRQLRDDREQDAPWRPAVISYVTPAGDTVRIPLRARTRGIWRLNNCEFPPLRLNFWHDSTAGTLFEGVDEPKLVNHCRDTDAYEEYVLQELQLYRVYALLTPFSHRARLLRMTYADGNTGRVRTTRWAFLIDEPGALARRTGSVRIDAQGARPTDLDPYDQVLHAMFQYLIGNTDWSVSALHNAELFLRSEGDTLHVPVAYDFDYSGAVNATYAVPPPQLRLRDVRVRRWRGYCAPREVLDRVIALFNERRDAIYALYGDEVGRLLRPRTAQNTLRYFDDFYRTINDPGAVEREIERRCLDGG